MPPPPYDFHIVRQVYVANPGIRKEAARVEVQDAH